MFKFLILGFINLIHSKMFVYFAVSISSGILLGTMDALINSNPYARKVYEFYKPIAKTSVNITAGVLINLVYGFVMVGVFLLFYQSLPGEAGIFKGISFAFLVWFFRVVMYVATQWLTLTVPIGTLLYMLFTGLFEMLILGIFYGLTLKP